MPAPDQKVIDRYQVLVKWNGADVITYLDKLGQTFPLS